MAGGVGRGRLLAPAAARPPKKPTRALAAVAARRASKILEMFKLGKLDHVQLLAQAKALLAQHGHKIAEATG